MSFNIVEVKNKYELSNICDEFAQILHTFELFDS